MQIYCLNLKNMDDRLGPIRVKDVIQKYPFFGVDLLFQP